LLLKKALDEVKTMSPIVLEAGNVLLSVMCFSLTDSARFLRIFLFTYSLHCRRVGPVHVSIFFECF